MSKALSPLPVCCTTIGTWWNGIVAKLRLHFPIMEADFINILQFWRFTQINFYCIFLFDINIWFWGLVNNWRLVGIMAVQILQCLIMLLDILELPVGNAKSTCAVCVNNSMICGLLLNHKHKYTLFLQTKCHHFSYKNSESCLLPIKVLGINFECWKL